MKLESNIIDPYIGQKAEGKIIDFESKKSIQKKELKVFKFKSTNQYIKIFTPEFIAVCPFSGLPDIAKITIEYFPKGELALELKALKYYLISYKNVGIYQEEVTKNIHLDLKEILNTDKIKITTETKQTRPPREPNSNLRGRARLRGFNFDGFSRQNCKAKQTMPARANLNLRAGRDRLLRQGFKQHVYVNYEGKQLFNNK